MSTWNDIPSPLTKDVQKAQMETAEAAIKEQAYSNLTSVTIQTIDGREVSAYLHQGSRSVYPKMDS